MTDPRDKEAIKAKRSEIDREILNLLVKRAKLSLEWAKDHPSGPTLPSSERETLRALADAAPADLPKEAVTGVFREVHALCRALEAQPKVAYLGAPGGHGHVAARKQFGPVATFSAHESIPDTVGEVTAGRADFAVLPFESATQGPVHQTLVALQRTDLRIVAVNEVDAPLCLLSQSGRLDDIDKVHATPRDRAAIQAHLQQAAPRAVVLDVSSPVQACQNAKDDPRSAAVALEPTGREHDLVVAQKFSPEGARARFCVAASRPASRTGKDVTCLLFSVSDEPGALFEVLKQLAERGVNMRKIHSWPGGGEGWEYLFFLELSGHVTDRPVVTALEGMKQKSKMLKVLGSYPV